MPAGETTVALWVGCYTSDMDGSGEGIVALARGADGSYEQLGPVTAVDSPSFLALHPSLPVLYAASEGAAQVHAFRMLHGGALTPLGPVGAAGSLVCHVAVDPEGAFLVASCWGDGSVVAFELEPDGSLGRRHMGAASEDPSGEGRQSRAHSCLMLGAGRLVTAEMGHDLLRLWSFTADRGLEAQGAVALPHGSGPRHFARSPAGVIYVDTEYSGEVAVLTARSGEPWLELRGMFPLAAGGVAPGDAAAEICLDPSGQQLLVGVRGSSRICTLTLDAEGMPTPLAEFPCGGDWPRHHCFDGEQLVVALQLSNALASFAPHADGHVTQQPRLLGSGSPTCVLPQR
jgi:6-phosphogluconolactonase (cycloisomerase 2 family)